MSRFKFLEFSDRPADGDGETGPEEFSADYFFARAEECFREGRFEEALRNYSRTLDEDNDYDSAWAGQVWALINLDEYPEAMMWANRGLKKYPDSPELLSLKGLLLAHRQKFEQALAHSDGAIQQKVKFPESVWLARGEILLLAGGGNERHCYLRAIGMKPKDAVILLRVGYSYLRCGYPDKALPYLNKAMTLPFTGHWLWLALARCHERMKDIDKALKYYRSAIRATPDLPEARTALRRLHPRGPIDRLLARLLKNKNGPGA